MAIPIPRQDCLNQIPSDTLEAAGKSAVYSFLAGTIFGYGSITLGIYSAIGSAVASLIDSLIRPLINLCFSREDREKSFSCYTFTRTLISGIIFSLLNIAVSTQLGIALEIGMLASVVTFLFLALFPSSGVMTIHHRQAQVIPVVYV